MTVKATTDNTGGAFSLLETTDPPTFRTRMHIHRDAAEAFYVLEGEYVFYVDDAVIRSPAGSFVHVPAGAAHGFRVGSQPSRKLNLFVPAAKVGYFEEVAEAGRSGDADADRLAAIAARYELEIVGPLPETPA
jgi:quercetin dioxygenase-like cupin family protein